MTVVIYNLFITAVATIIIALDYLTMFRITRSCSNSLSRMLSTICFLSLLNNPPRPNNSDWSAFDSHSSTSLVFISTSFSANFLAIFFLCVYVAFL